MGRKRIISLISKHLVAIYDIKISYIMDMTRTRDKAVRSVSEASVGLVFNSSVISFGEKSVRIRFYHYPYNIYSVANGALF